MHSHSTNNISIVSIRRKGKIRVQFTSLLFHGKQNRSHELRQQYLPPPQPVHEASDIGTPFLQHISVIPTTWIILKWNCTEREQFWVYKKSLNQYHFTLQSEKHTCKLPPLLPLPTAVALSAAQLPAGSEHGMRPWGCPGTPSASCVPMGDPGHTPVPTALRLSTYLWHGAGESHRVLETGSLWGVQMCTHTCARMQT